MANAKRDDNRVTTLQGVTDDGNSTPTNLIVHPTTKRLKCTATLSNVTPAQGGTGQTTYSKGDILVARNATTLDKLAVGTDGQILTADSASTDGVKWNTGGTGTVTSVSVTTANGVSGSVATATTTPAITLTLGAITPTSVNGLTVTSSTGTLTVANGKTATVSNTLTLAGTDSTTQTFPSTSATIARTDAGQTFTGTQVMTSPKILTSVLDTNGNEVVDFVATASAVNEVELTNAATGTTGPLIKPQGETNIDLRLSGKGTGAIHKISGCYGDITADSDKATITFNLATSNIHAVTLGGNRTLALSNEHVGQCFMLRLLQDGTGSRTVTWFSTIKWAGGAAPTLTTTASKADLLGFVVTSAGNYDGFVIGQNI